MCVKDNLNHPITREIITDINSIGNYTAWTNFDLVAKQRKKKQQQKVKMHLNIFSL